MKLDKKLVYELNIEVDKMMDKFHKLPVEKQKKIYKMIAKCFKPQK